MSQTNQYIRLTDMDHPIPVGEQHQVVPNMFSVVHIEVLKNSDSIILHLMVHLNQKTGLHGSTGFNIKYHPAHPLLPFYWS